MNLQNKKQSASKAGKIPRSKLRRKSRELALQALYQMGFSDDSAVAVEEQFVSDNDMSKADCNYFSTLLKGVTRDIKDLDKAFSPVLDRPFDQLDLIEKSILRIGCFELLRCMDVPYRVIINEAIELAKGFGAEESHKYINGILDKLAPRIRTAEVREYRINKLNSRS